MIFLKYEKKLDLTVYIFGRIYISEDLSII